MIHIKMSFENVTHTSNDLESVDSVSGLYLGASDTYADDAELASRRAAHARGMQAPRPAAQHFPSPARGVRLGRASFGGSVDQYENFQPFSNRR